MTNFKEFLTDYPPVYSCGKRAPGFRNGIKCRTYETLKMAILTLKSFKISQLLTNFASVCWQAPLFNPKLSLDTSIYPVLWCLMLKGQLKILGTERKLAGIGRNLHKNIQECFLSVIIPISNIIRNTSTPWLCKLSP